MFSHSLEKKLQILLVEDSPVSALLVEVELQRKAAVPFELKTTSWLQEALAYLHSNSPDVILLDLTLPDSKGLDTVSSICKPFPHLPVIILSGGDEDYTALNALKLGAQDYVHKTDLDGRLLWRTILYSVERTRTRRQLQELSAQRDDFMAVLSHDLKNNLIGMSRLLQSLSKGASGYRPDQERLIDLIKQSCDDSLVMTNDLLELYRHQSGIECLRLEPAQLAPIIERAIRETLHYALARGIQIACDISPSPIEANVDKTALTHVVSNLLHNAIKFSPEGSLVTVCLHNQHDSLVIKVRDRGEGIPLEDQQKLFLRFSQGRLGKIHPGSTGLGLFLSYRIMQLHQGTLSYATESGYGEGSIFVITLPIPASAGVITEIGGCRV